MDDDKVKSLSKYIKDMEIKSSRGLYYDKSLFAEDKQLTLDELRTQAEALGYTLVKVEYESTDLTGTNKIKLN